MNNWYEKTWVGDVINFCCSICNTATSKREQMFLCMPEAVTIHLSFTDQKGLTKVLSGEPGSGFPSHWAAHTRLPVCSLYLHLLLLLRQTSDPWVCSGKDNMEKLMMWKPISEKYLNNKQYKVHAHTQRSVMQCANALKLPPSKLRFPPLLRPIIFSIDKSSYCHILSKGSGVCGEGQAVPRDLSICSSKLFQEGDTPATASPAHE